jgi:hypothetical protein
VDGRRDLVRAFVRIGVGPVDREAAVLLRDDGAGTGRAVAPVDRRGEVGGLRIRLAGVGEVATGTVLEVCSTALTLTPLELNATAAVLVVFAVLPWPPSLTFVPLAPMSATLAVLVAFVLLPPASWMATLTWSGPSSA